jgi:hypothetical protein
MEQLRTSTEVDTERRHSKRVRYEGTPQKVQCASHSADLYVRFGMRGASVAAQRECLRTCLGR